MLKELIQSKGFKQRFLASKLGVSEVTMSNWVSGKARPTAEHAEKLAEILNVSVDKILW